ncbi:N-acetyltransferase [Paenibacillus sp. CFBP13512]|uniref:GNAT family N-acetyltransferase n=1 Tax=Paenibacillus sp. CFBP13512 TaxID=2184007 RepID=UPI0010C1327B|nr:GNAT family N-acetyltransferase [Paenibacillus sp. CFBP13512]TKJ90585.1 N-acetyltransferase [Paenibacillus sp. CFBP13512]
MSDPHLPYTIEIARQEDLPAIVDIYNSSIPARLATADTEPVTVESRQAWFDEHVPDRRPLWVLWQEGQIAGWASLQTFYGRPAYNGTVELSVYVHNDYQGKGIGSKLVSYAIEQAPSLHIHTLLGFVFAHNDPSLKLLRKFGFEDWGHLPRVAILDDVERHLAIVGKRIESK